MTRRQVHELLINILIIHINNIFVIHLWQQPFLKNIWHNIQNSKCNWKAPYLLYNSAQSLPSQSLPIFFFEYINSAPLCRQGLGRVGVAGAWEYPWRATDWPGILWGLGNFRIWFSGHGFQDLGSQLWGLGNFRIWFSGHGFRDLGSQLWGLGWEYPRQATDRPGILWGLGNFRIWFSGHGFQDLGSQLWGLGNFRI